MILLKRLDQEEHVNRWYFVTVQPSLFHSHAVILGWGSRENEFQQWRVIPVESASQAQEYAERVVSKKLKRGYQVVGFA